MSDQPITYTAPASAKTLDELPRSNLLSLTEMRFEPGSQITRFERGTFEFCFRLKSLCVPASVEFIGPECFGQCGRRHFPSSLKRITFEKGSKLREIAASAFSGCDSLHAISLPASVTLFTGASVARSGIRKISVEAGNGCFRVSDGAVVDAEGRILVRYVGKPETFPVLDSIEILGVSSFDDCPFLHWVVFGLASRLAEIQEAAFRRCSRLKSFCVPATVAVIGCDCFRHCGRLRTVSFCAGSKLTRIGEGAFAFCVRLKALDLPAAVEWVGRNCFSRSSSLRTLTFSAPAHLRELLGLPPEGPDYMEIPDSVEALEFKDCRLPPCSRHLKFGRYSKLMTIKAKARRAFLELTTPSLAKIRRDLEFSSG